MPTRKTRVKARQQRVCDFCRSKIDKGEAYVKSFVKDRFGHYTTHHHEHCQRTFELNSVSEVA